MKKILAAVITLHIVLSLFVIFVADRELWFDVAFSLETANKLNANGYNSIDFHNYDVHPPTYYYLLSFWQDLNPAGISEYQWAQLLSVLFSVGFLVFVVAAVNKVFGKSNALIIGSFFAISTTYLHYATEVRMYSLVFLLSAMGFYGIIAGGKWRYASLAAILLLPNVHYLAAIASVTMVAAYVLITKGNVTFNKKWLGAFVASLAIGIAFALTYAIPQKLRAAGMWFQTPSFVSIPSSLFYSLFTTNDVAITNAFTIIVFSGFCISLFLFYRKVFRTLQDKSAFTQVKRIWFAFALTSIIPILYIIGDNFIIRLFGSGGFAQLYHHRFFLSVTWMFVIAYLMWVIDAFKDNVRLNYFFRTHFSKILIVVIAFSMLFVYSVTVQNSLTDMMVATPCSTNLTYIGHENPATSLPFTVYARENNCNWINFISTNLSVELSRSAGFDVVPQDNVYWNTALPDYGFFYVREPNNGMFDLSNRSQSVVAIDKKIVELISVGAK